MHNQSYLYFWIFTDIKILHLSLFLQKNHQEQVELNLLHYIYHPDKFREQPYRTDRQSNNYYMLSRNSSGSIKILYNQLINIQLHTSFWITSSMKRTNSSDFTLLTSFMQTGMKTTKDLIIYQIC